MIYDKSKLKKLKGTLVRMKYSAKGEPNNLTGIIEYLSNDYFMFSINGGPDVRVKYENVEDIEKIRSYNSYMRKVKYYANLFMYQKAFDIVFKLQQGQLFNLPEQIKEIDRLKLKYQGKLMQKFKDPDGLDEAIKEDDVMELRDTLKNIENEI